MKPAETNPSPSASTDRCLARSVAATMAEEPSLEAVTIDPANAKISLATIGRADVDHLARRLSQQIQSAQAAAPELPCSLLVGKSDCAACDSSRVDLGRQQLTIRQLGEATTIARQTCPTAPKFWRWREIPFPKLVPRTIIPIEEEHSPDEWRWQMVMAVACGCFGLLGVFANTPFHWMFFAAAYVAGGFFPAVEVVERLRQRILDVHFLMLAVAGGAAAIGAWTEGSILLFLFSLSGAMEHFALGRTQREIQALFRDAPKLATILDPQGHESEFPVDELRPGMRLLIKPGAQFPVDAEIVHGATAADESNLTGEAVPVPKAMGDTVLAGTLNLWGAVQATVLRPASASALQKIITLIREARRQKAPAQRFTDQFGTRYTYCILGLAVAMFFVWWFALHLPPFRMSSSGSPSAFYRAMTLLVVASPCALVLSIPSAVLAAIASGARHGILFRGGAAVEKLSRVDLVALDKTGTLTTGDLRVAGVESFPPGSEQDLLRAAYSLAQLSSHPLSRALSRHGKQSGLKPFECSHFESFSGQGLGATHGDRSYLMGSKDFLRARRDHLGLSTEQSNNLSVHLSPDHRLTNFGASEVWLASGDLLGRILLTDEVRPEARRLLEQLHSAHLKSVVLTGDGTGAAERLRTELPLDEVRAGLSPEQKVAAIKGFSVQGHRVAMVGDGVNDAPSLAAADVGIAMGARAADAALEQADVVLMHDRLENFFAAYRLSRRAATIIRQNLVVSLGTILVLVVCSLSGVIPLTIGVVGHEGSTVVVVLNSLRLLFPKLQRE